MHRASSFRCVCFYIYKLPTSSSQKFHTRPACFVPSRMRSMKSSVSPSSLIIECVAHLYVAKATDENLTSENWEYILVRIDVIIARFRRLT